MNCLQRLHCSGAHGTHDSHLVNYVPDFMSFWESYHVSDGHKYMFCVQNVIKRCSLGYTSHCTLATDTLKTFQTHHVSMKRSHGHHLDSTVMQMELHMLWFSCFFLCGCILKQIWNMMSLYILWYAGDPLLSPRALRPPLWASHQCLAILGLTCSHGLLVGVTGGLLGGQSLILCVKGAGWSLTLPYAGFYSGCDQIQRPINIVQMNE